MKMGKFARFNPNKRSKDAPKNLTIRLALPKDCPDISNIKYRRNGGMLKVIVARTKKEIIVLQKSSRFKIFSALIGKKIVGYGSISYFDARHDKAIFKSPSGWYCGGVIVENKYRRMNIGTAIFEAFFKWLADKADYFHSFVSCANKASIKLHNNLGFKEYRRAAGFLNVRFDCGEGILFKRKI